MSSPRSSWTGTISLGLFSAEISLAPAFKEEREESIKDICIEHKLPVDRSERCKGDPECDLGQTKGKGIEVSEGVWRALNKNEQVAIEDATDSKVLEVVEAHPLKELPMHLSIGNYFVRPTRNNAVAAQNVKVLHAALAKSKYGLVVKWGTKTRERLAVIYTAGDTVMLNKIPMAHEVREAQEQELAHQDAEAPKEAVPMMIELIKTRQTEEFDHSAYMDTGLKLRQEAVQKVASGEIEDLTPAEPTVTMEEAPDIMKVLEAEIAAAK